METQNKLSENILQMVTHAMMSSDMLTCHLVLCLAGLEALGGGGGSGSGGCRLTNRRCCLSRFRLIFRGVTLWRFHLIQLKLAAELLVLMEKQRREGGVQTKRER